MFLRKDDQVVIITGDDKGPQPRKVLRAIPKENKVVVEGVNRVYKHLKPSAKNRQGGRLSKEMPINASNALLYCSTCNRGVRIGMTFTPAGQKQRTCKLCKGNLGNVGPAKPNHAARPQAQAAVK